MVLFILIFFVMIIAVGASAVIGFSIFMKRRSKRLEAENVKQFDEPPAYKSLFEPSDEEVKEFEREENAWLKEQAAEKRKQALVLRAAENDLTVLRECADDKILYDEVLDKITGAAKSDEQIITLAKFILADKLRSSSEIVGKFGAVWSRSFDKTLTLDYLELAARSEQAEVYSQALEAVTAARRKGFVKDISGSDFVKLAEADFRLLSDDERASGAGFSIKEKLAEMRREES